MNSSWRRPVWLVAIVPAVSSLLFLAGCSNNNPAPPGDAAATEPATTVAADEDEIVHLSQEKAGVPSPGQTMFTSAEQAAGVFKDSVLAKDRRTLAALFGDEGKALVFSGDKVQENNDLQACGQRLTAYLHVDHPTETTAILRIGSENWPFPIPVVKGADGWFFDTVAGRDELLNRRIGEDELNAIAVCRAYVLAQNEYAKKDRMGGGVVQFAQHMMSRAGTRDGLYWEVAEGEEMSPMGPLVAEARLEGYPATQPINGKPHAYQGSIFHILKAQGTSSSPDLPLYDFKKFNSLIGFEEVWEFERRWARSDNQR